MKYFYIPIIIALALVSSAGHGAFAQVPPDKPPVSKPLMGQVPPDATSYWELFNTRMEAENAQYAEEHPDWPKGEPAPRHIAKKALNGISGKNLLEGVRDGVKLTREANTNAPEAERDLQIELAIERVVEFFPLVETNPNGYTNLFYVISSINSDPVYRCYLIKRSHPSELPDTLFSLYFQDKCKERLNDLLGRYKNIIISPGEDTTVQKTAIAALQALVLNDVMGALEADREVQRLVSNESIEISPGLLKGENEKRISVETRERINVTLLILDEVLLSMQNQFLDDSTRPDWLKANMLDFIEDSLQKYKLPSAKLHIEFLAKQGREFVAIATE